MISKWPDEKAKMNFYPKMLNNPGLISYTKGKADDHRLSVGQLICKSGIFKQVKAYMSAKTKHELLKIKLDKHREEPKICMNWTCGRKFIDKEELNTRKSCLCHPGKFDHGSTGTKMVKFISDLHLEPKDRKTILWEPHWTCCNKPWETKGCKLTRHKGIFAEEVEANNPRPYKWPDVRAKLYFSKTVSDRWLKTIEPYVYSEERIMMELGKDSWNLSNLPSLCDKLRLYMLVVNPKPDYQLKFMDVVSQNNSINYFLDSNNCVKHKEFIQWWFGDYEVIMDELIKMRS